MMFDVGSTSKSLDIWIVDDSGLPVAGLLAATFPTLTYSRGGPNADVAFPALSDLAAITTAWTAGGVKERGNGVYRLDVPDAMLATIGDVTIRGEETDKRLIVGLIEVENNVADAVCDEVLTGTTHNIPSSLGRRLRQITDGGLYEGGHVHVDAISGVAGTETFVNGTVLSPSNNIADATTLAVALGLRSFKIRNGSSLTATQDYDRYDFIGESWTMAFGGRDLTGCRFRGAACSGVALGTGIIIEKGFLDTVTIPPASFVETGVRGTVTLAAGIYYFVSCYGAAAIGVSFTLDFGAAVGVTAVRLRQHSGVVVVNNLATGDEIALDGWGRLSLGASCTGGTAIISGTISFSNAGTGVTVTQSSRYNVDQPVASVTGSVGSVTGLTAANLDVAVSTLATAANLATVAGYLDTEIAAILADTNELQTDWANGGRLDTILDAAGGGDVTLAEFGASALAQLAALDTINVTGAVTGSGVVNLTQGGDYLTANGRQLQFVNAAGSLPNLTGAIPWLLFRNAGVNLTAIQGTVITASGLNQRVDFDVPHSVTDLLTARTGTFEVWAVMPTSNNEIPIESGVLNVIPRIRA